MLKRTLAFVIAASLAVAAFAASVHLKQNRNPTFVDNGLYLQAVGSLAGLGNGDVVISINANGNVTATCTNPGGSNQPAGHNPVPISVAGTVAIPEEEVKNGTLRFDVRTVAPSATIAGAPDCPNGNWTERIQDIAFTSFSLTVEQPAGVVVLRLACTTTTPTVNGSVNPNTIACTAS